LRDLRIAKKIETNSPAEWKTIKYLFETMDNKFFEAVLIFEDTLTLCVSSQIGCPVKCAFCRTGQDKFERNLTSWEIVSQVKLVEKDIGREIECVSYMGMGEPLLNIENVMESMKMLSKQYKLSTIGINGKIAELAKINIPIDLYFSLHCAKEEKRKRLIPFSKNYQLANILEEINEFSKKKGGVILWYLMLDNENDEEEDAKELVNILKKLNNIKLVILKEYCETGTGFKKSKVENVKMFQKKLENTGISYRCSISAGQKINAGCGQLRQQFMLEAR